MIAHCRCRALCALPPADNSATENCKLPQHTTHIHRQTDKLVPADDSSLVSATHTHRIVQEKREPPLSLSLPKTLLSCSGPHLILGSILARGRKWEREKERECVPCFPFFWQLLSSTRQEHGSFAFAFAFAFAFLSFLPPTLKTVLPYPAVNTLKHSVNPFLSPSFALVVFFSSSVYCSISFLYLSLSLSFFLLTVLLKFSPFIRRHLLLMSFFIFYYFSFT